MDPLLYKNILKYIKNNNISADVTEKERNKSLDVVIIMK